MSVHPRLLPVDLGWTGDLADAIASKIASIPRMSLSNRATMTAVHILSMVQEAIDTQGPGIEAGRKEMWAKNAYAILQSIRENRGLTERSLADIDHMFAMIERPPDAPGT